MSDPLPSVPTTTATGESAESGNLRWRDAPPDPFTGPQVYQGVLWRRIFAYMADVTIIAVILAAAWMVAVTLGIATLGLLWPLLWVPIACIPFAYHTLLIGGAHSATWGMRLFDIEVRDWDGGRPNFLQAAAMTAVFYISVSLTVWLVLVIAPFNDYHRTLQDFATRLVVVRAPPRAAAPSELTP